MEQQSFKLDYKLLDDVIVDNIIRNQYPEFPDAYISSAMYDGRKMTAEELEVLNEDKEFILKCIYYKLS